MNAIKEILRNNFLRPTKQRVMVGQLLFNGVDKHVTAESLYRELKETDQKISLATVYNTLHDFYKKNLIKKVTIDTEIDTDFTLQDMRLLLELILLPVYPIIYYIVFSK